MRIFHKYTKVKNWIEEAASVMANIINIHHGNDLKPFINYPFVEKDALRDFTEKAHKKIFRQNYIIQFMSFQSMQTNLRPLRIWNMRYL